MSSVVISGNTSGAITLSAPDVAGTNTITLPASTGYLFVTPTAGTLSVDAGGTGITTTTAYGILAGGTTATGAFQNIGTGTASQVLTSNGPGVLPSFQAAAAGGFSNMTVFTSPGTFTTPSTTTKIKVTVVGGGGGGGSAGPGFSGIGGGGGGGAIYVGPVTASTGYPVTVGSGGSPGNPASAGGTSSFGALASATGGSGGQGSGNDGNGSSGGAGSAGTLQVSGGAGLFGWGPSAAPQTWCYGGAGGSSILGGGARGRIAGGSSSYAGIPGGNYGGGGSGGSATGPSGTPQSGGSGAGGVVVVEY